MAERAGKIVADLAVDAVIKLVACKEALKKLLDAASSMPDAPGEMWSDSRQEWYSEKMVPAIRKAREALEEVRIDNSRFWNS